MALTYVRFLTLILAAFLPAATFAATVTIEQSGNMDRVGGWTLMRGDAWKVQSTDPRVSPYAHTIRDVQSGTYSFQVVPPEGGEMTMRVYNHDVFLTETSETKSAFFIEGGDAVRLSITYVFTGTMDVQSEPSGVTFTITAPNRALLKGVTPHSFQELPPYYYTASFNTPEGCMPQKQQKRALTTGGHLTFFARFLCPMAEEEVTTPPEEEEKTIVPPPSPAGSVSLTHFATQEEILAGGQARVVIRLKNTSRRTLQNLLVTEYLDPEVLTPEVNLQRGGVPVPNGVQWRIAQLNPGESWSVSLGVRASPHLPAGTMTQLTASVSGEDLRAPVGAIATLGVTTLPATGVTIDLLATLFGMGTTVLLVRLQKRMVSRSLA